MTGLLQLTVEDHADAEARAWHKEFAWHLDQVPLLLETMGVLAITTVRASRIDQVKVSGGGYIDNVPVTDGNVNEHAQVIWSMLVEYLRAVTEWLNVTVPAPWAPYLPSLATDRRQWVAPTVNADPLTARRLAFDAIAWLIDHAEQIRELTQLDEYRAALFATIRQARGRYRSAGTRRRARPRPCGVCGECAVIVDWVDGANGSPRPVQVGLCKVCGQVYTDTAEKVAAGTTNQENYEPESRIHRDGPGRDRQGDARESGLPDGARAHARHADPH